VSWRNGSALASGAPKARLPKAAGSSPADIVLPFFILFASTFMHPYAQQAFYAGGVNVV
jgi:hypothetical protein